MIHDPLDHEKRSREVADSTRRFIIGANSGAVAAVLAIAGKLMDPSAHQISPRWALWPLGCFVLSFVLVYTSMAFAKFRELGRMREALTRKHKPGDVAEEEDLPLWQRSTLWDTFAALVLGLGVTWALYRLNQLVA